MVQGEPLKMRVAIFTLYDTEGASSNYRIYQYLNNIKIYADVQVFCFWPNKYVSKYMTNKEKYKVQIGITYLISLIKRVIQILYFAPNYETIIIQKAVVPKIKNDFMANIKKKNRNIIFDVDDAIYLEPRDNSDAIASKATTVMCGSQTLIKHYSKFNRNTIFVPTVENDKVYDHFRNDTFENKVIGWLGTNTNLPNLDLIVNPVNRIIDKHPEVSFHLICDQDGGFGTKIKNLVFIKWDKDTVMSELSKFTVGIMPLVDNETNRGKCGFKLIQYMTMGKPVVGSPVGENRIIINFGGYAAKDEWEWKIALERLLFDQKVYQKWCKTIDDKFYKSYSYKSNCERIKVAICGSMKGGS